MCDEVFTKCPILLLEESKTYMKRHNVKPYRYTSSKYIYILLVMLPALYMCVFRDVQFGQSLLAINTFCQKHDVNGKCSVHLQNFLSFKQLVYLHDSQITFQFCTYYVVKMFDIYAYDDFMK